MALLQENGSRGELEMALEGHFFIWTTLVLIQSKSEQNLPHYIIQYIPLSIEDQFLEWIFKLFVWHSRDVTEQLVFWHFLWSSSNQTKSVSVTLLQKKEPAKCAFYKPCFYLSVWTHHICIPLLYMYSTFHLVSEPLRDLNCLNSRLLTCISIAKYTRAHSLRWWY